MLKISTPTPSLIFCIFSLSFRTLTAANVPMEAIKRDKAKSYSNMVVRVLLERDSAKAKVASSLKSLYIKLDEGRDWQTFPKEIGVAMRNRKGKKGLTLNGVTLSTRSLLMRAGTHYSDKVQYNGQYYRGALKITEDGENFTATNVIPLDEYLAGTLAAEMHGSWEEEALKAQAVASRSYAVYMIQHPKNPVFDMDKSTQDQVYGGSDKESKKIQKVISDTAGMYLTYQGDPVKAYFHARCGGTTETASNVWNFKNNVFKTAVPCPYCRKQPYKWIASISTKELIDTLKLPFNAIKALSNFSAEKTQSGRVAALKFNVSGVEKKVTSDELRSLLGYSRIKSANFDWKIEKDRVQFEGKGNGHGVGMCQWGARYLAKQGKNFKEILAHYYPGAKLEKLD